MKNYFLSLSLSFPIWNIGLQKKKKKKLWGFQEVAGLILQP